jgi:hypothetical protein
MRADKGASVYAALSLIRRSAPPSPCRGEDGASRKSRVAVDLAWLRRVDMHRGEEKEQAD